MVVVVLVLVVVVVVVEVVVRDVNETFKPETKISGDRVF